MARLPSLTSGVLLAAQLWLAPVTAQTLNTSDTAPGPFPTDDDQLQLSPPTGYRGSSSDEIPRINLVNLTAAAVTRLDTTRGEGLVIRDSIVYIAPNTTASPTGFSSSNIALIPCDPAPDFLQPLQAVQDAISASSPAIIVYSATQDYCNLTTGGNVPADYIIYSTTNASAYLIIEEARTRASYGGPYPPQWYVGRKAVLDNVTMADRDNGGPPFGGGSGSPTTAVAMIILYSITGVITALFLIIIVTGAVRAHRHPERYGPRNVLGRPRQSRAKGLARAMLDTLPIVKFGEKEEDRAKPIDVELANTRSSTAVEGGETGTLTQAKKEAPEVSTTDADTEAGADKASTSSDTNAAIAAGAAAVASSSSQTQPEGDAPGCSICTEDFERGQDVRVLPCQHSFHPACIDPWLLNVSGTCPLCRIDLRPEGERENDARASADGTLPPPLDAAGAEASGLAVPQNHRASRRLSGFITDILNPSHMQSASREERIAALRRFREHRNQSVAEEAEARRRRRLTARLGETFGVRTRARDASPPASSASEAPASTLAPPTEAGSSRSIAEEHISEEPSRPAAPASDAHQR